MQALKLLKSNPLLVLAVIAICAFAFDGYSKQGQIDELEDNLEEVSGYYESLRNEHANTKGTLSLCESQLDQCSDSAKQISKDCKAKYDLRLKNAVESLKASKVKPAGSAEEFNEWLEGVIKWN